MRTYDHVGKGKKVLLPPTDCGGGNWIAFVEEEGIAIELMWQENK